MSDKPKPALDLDALATLADAATPGPWSGERDPGSSMYFVLRNVPGDYIHIATRGWTWADVNFIGHARESVPALIARVREAERERDELRAKIARVFAFADYPYRDGELTPEQYAKISTALRTILGDV